MKKIFALLLCCLILSGCAGEPAENNNPTTVPTASSTEITKPFTEAASPIDTEATSESEPKEVIKFIVYSPNSNADGFYVNVLEWNIVEGSDYRPTLLEALIEVCVLTEDVQIHSMVQDGTHMTIDFNHAFKDLVCTMGTSGEYLTVGSIVNTLIANYEVETVSITVDGETWESGHVIYDSPMGFFN